MIEIKEIISEKEGVRIDAFIAEETDFSRSKIQELIKKGKISVNGEKIKSSYKVSENDKILIEIPEVKEVFIESEDIDIDIIYEDKDIAIINKKAGMVVHPAKGHYNGTMVNAIMHHIKDLSGINGELRPGIVHRLDKDTSGLVIIAKNDLIHNKLSYMFKEKEIEKTYIAILKGKLNKESGRIETLIARDKRDRKKMAVVRDTFSKGKNAITEYEVLDKNDKFTLVKLGLLTGRTHQIRVHMKHIKHPILGDSVYGRSDSEKRQMLHAYMLKFKHPTTNEEIKIVGKVHEDFENALIKCGFSLEEITKI